MNASPPAITVLMPVHNGDAYLDASVQSILDQSFRDFELLAVDDGSTDRTPALLQQAAQRDPRVRVIGGGARLGFSAALNLGLDAARGEYVARMDADDVAAPDRLACQHAYLEAHPEIGLCGGRVATFGLREGTFHRPPLTAEETRCYLLFDNPFAHPTVMVRRALLERHQLRFDASYCPADDYELWARALAHFPGVNLNQVLLRYRIHARSLTQAEWGDMDAHAARVAARELAALGLPVDDDTVRLHRNIGRGRCCPVESWELLDRAESWLRQILAANAQRARYPQDALARTVADVWYRVCAHAGQLGVRMVRRYARSPLRAAHATTAREWLALVRAAIRKGNVSPP